MQVRTKIDQIGYLVEVRGEGYSCALAAMESRSFIRRPARIGPPRAGSALLASCRISSEREKRATGDIIIMEHEVIFKFNFRM